MWNIIGMSCAELGANYCIKRYAESEKRMLLIVGILLYLLMVYMLIRSFRTTNHMMHVNTIWQGVVVILGALFGFFLLGERFEHPVQYFGIVLGILAVACVNYKGSKYFGRQT
jgi:multidrug transporter EmrE-like cation transporter